MTQPESKRLVTEARADAVTTAKINDAASTTRAALNATFVPKWKATTAYLAGDKVLNPSGDVVSAIANFTSGASYNAANWALPATVSGKLDKTEAAASYSRPTTAGLSDRFAPKFTAITGAMISQSTSGLPSIYFPWVIRMDDKLSTPLGKFYMYYSTDHDTNGGGIGMAYSNTPEGPWTAHKPGGNPILYKDTVSGSQTETPCVIYVPEDTATPFYLYYQQDGTGLNQSTFLAKSADGVTWTRAGLVIQGRANTPGDGQTTYFRVFRAGDMLMGYHLGGGGDYGSTSMSYSRDGVTWVSDPRRIGYFTDIVGGNTGRVSVRSLFLYRGQTWALLGQEPYSSGFTGGTGKKFLTAKPSADLRRILGKPREVFPTLPTGVTELDLWASVIENEGNLYMFYRANGAYGDIRSAKSVA
jgi:hypothetical protein